MNLYGHVIDESRREAAELMGRILGHADQSDEQQDEAPAVVHEAS